MDRIIPLIFHLWSLMFAISSVKWANKGKTRIFKCVIAVLLHYFCLIARVLLCKNWLNNQFKAEVKSTIAYFLLTGGWFQNGRLLIPPLKDMWKVDISAAETLCRLTLHQVKLLYSLFGCREGSSCRKTCSYSSWIRRGICCWVEREILHLLMLRTWLKLAKCPLSTAMYYLAVHKMIVLKQ